jgi:hypothetical protein
MRGGVILKPFSARDVVSRWDVVELHRRATSLAAARFLDSLLDRTPFPIKVLQVDGGSEFAAEFEEACLQKDLPLFVLPPKSPKLNAHVERSNRTHNEEFYEVQAESDQVPVLKTATGLGENLQLCPPASVAGLPYPTGIHHPMEAKPQRGKVSLIYWTSTGSCNLKA